MATTFRAQLRRGFGAHSCEGGERSLVADPPRVGPGDQDCGGRDEADAGLVQELGGRAGIEELDHPVCVVRGQ